MQKTKSVTELIPAFQDERRQKDFHIAINERSEADYQSYIALKNLLELLDGVPLLFSTVVRETGLKLEEVKEIFEDAAEIVRFRESVNNLVIAILSGHLYDMKVLHKSEEDEF